MSAHAVTSDVVAFLDETLRTRDIPDYPNALNGLQLAHRGPVRMIAAAVDASLRSIDGAVAAGANLLIVHHGLFWNGAQRVEGTLYQKLSTLMTNDVAVYSAHLPLDTHADHGNSVLLARHLGLSPQQGFAAYRDIQVGVQGEADIATSSLRERLESFARTHGGAVVATPFPSNRITRRWAICSGSGANVDTLREAHAAGIDTLIVGEGPHWTAVDAIDAGLVILYAGHYVTETLGVQSIADSAAQRFSLPWVFVEAPTGL